MTDRHGSPPSNVVAFLQQLPLFEGITESGIQSIARGSHVRSLPRGQVLFDQSTPSDRAYIIRTGSVDLVLSTPDGRELVINSMESGDIFGELGVLTGELRSTRAIAREPSEVISIAGSALLVELDRQPRLMRRILNITSQRLRLSTERESALAFMDAPARLARVLLRLSDEERHSHELVTISQEDLAQHVGATRQTIASILGRWRRRGWIITGRGRIMLVDRSALRRQGDGPSGG
jgi:CRP/FNR family cyclic AMP-dependent transcriptional regulator